MGQEENHLPYAIYFISKNMNPAELNYTVTEKEFLAVIYAINKFQYYITGYSTFVHTDHSDIKYLMNKYVKNSRVTRLLLLLSAFNQERKSTTTFSFPGRSTIVISNSCNNNNHLVNQAFVTDLFIKYLIVDWSVWKKVE